MRRETVKGGEKVFYRLSVGRVAYGVDCNGKVG